MDTEIIVGIIIFILLSFFAIVIFIGLGISDRTTNDQNIISTTDGNFLSSCLTASCSDNLICDGNTFTCKLPAGRPCNDFTDCANGLICSGLCATGATGGLNQLCPCGSGYLCSLQPGGMTLCKGAGGTSCQIGADCASELCQNNGTCAAGSPNSFPCTMSSQCASGNCNNGFCQNPGVVTGTLGAACDNRDCISLPPGVTGARCETSVSNPLICECISGVGQPGTCVAATQGILSTCSTLSACSNDLVCLTTNADVCDGNTGCICVFPYTDPNTQATGASCIEGMSAAQSICFNNNGLGCSSGGMCINSTCGGPSILSIYKFGTRDTPDLLTNYAGSTSTSINIAANGPTGNIQPYKMFAVSNGRIDTIYLVDHIQGFLYIEYNTESMTVQTQWTQLIPLITTINSGTTTSTRTLIDVGFANTTSGPVFLVAFDEVVAVTGGPTRQNDTVYIGTTPTSLSPFNVSGSDLPGTQYTSGNVALSINYIDVSPSNIKSSGGDALISFNGTIYIKPVSSIQYNIGTIVGGPMNNTQMTGLTGPARFYFDNTQNVGGTGPSVCPFDGTDSPIECQSYENVSFVGNFQSFGSGGNTGNYEQVLQFSGNVAGIGLPIDRFGSIQYKVFDYSIYSSPIFGMTNAGIIMLTHAFNGANLIDTVVAVSSGGLTTLLPYRISTSSRSVVSANAFYVISIGSCT
jgi:hypothetical protein